MFSHSHRLRRQNSEKDEFSTGGGLFRRRKCSRGAGSKGIPMFIRNVNKENDLYLDFVMQNRFVVNVQKEKGLACPSSIRFLREVKNFF